MAETEPIDRDESWTRFLAAGRADTRIEVVKRAINRCLLAGMPDEISDYGAWLVVDALDNLDPRGGA